MLRIVRILTFCVIVSAINARKFEEPMNEWKKLQEFLEFLQWKKVKQSREYANQPMTTRTDGESEDDLKQVFWDPPPIDDAALMARYVVNQADWASIATISTRKDIETFPTANLISISDGPVGNGSGIPYMYLTPLDFTARDLIKDHRASLLVTLAQGSYCKNKEWDPMDPRCARIILSGKIKALKDKNEEYEIAKQAIFGRHPSLSHLPADHRFFFAKLKISAIAVLDTFGGPKYVNVKDYFYPSVDNVEKKLYRSNRHL